MRFKNTALAKHPYKLMVVISVFCLIVFHFIAMAVFPDNFMASQPVLIMILILMMYLWIQEFYDSQKLVFLNQNLIEAQRRLEKAQVDSIAALILTAEAKDTYTHGHSRRVAQYSIAIAKEMGLSEEEQKIIERAAILHDLGKIGIDDYILRKADKLSQDEWDTMKSHPYKAIDILKPLKFLTTEKDIILHHHERCDGSGYPKGLKEEMIPLGSKIIAVADTFDAMNMVRPYRNSLSREIIVGELRKCSERQLSKDAVNIFLRLLEKNPELWNLL